MQSYTVFLVAFIEEFRWSRAETLVAYSVSQLVAGAGSPLVGVLVDRLGPRRLLLLGGSLFVLGLLGSVFIAALWQIILLYGMLMTIGANCLGWSSCRCSPAILSGALAKAGGAAWLKTTLVQCATAGTRKKTGYLQAQLHRLRARRGAKKAIGAVTASILTAAYEMLKSGALYEDLGSNHFDKRGKSRHIHRLVHRLQDLGFCRPNHPTPTAA
jgi:MFS family permease